MLDKWGGCEAGVTLGSGCCSWLPEIPVPVTHSLARRTTRGDLGPSGACLVGLFGTDHVDRTRVDGSARDGGTLRWDGSREIGGGELSSVRGRAQQDRMHDPVALTVATPGWSNDEPRTMSVRVCPHLGVGLWLWLGVTLGLGQGQGEGCVDGPWEVVSASQGPLRSPPPATPLACTQLPRVMKGQETAEAWPCRGRQGRIVWPPSPEPRLC
ncbi:hypothetical protein J1605_012990 [Eschrichtius robustus]|uniref:Uncharacterized protein n=1 Tax=Eschrichtius robustus TaxID=9764 RepID=A0AB34GI72_ESCRO|nr:hypothetical protein J1605_012990 [Eschrichtius robustus]